MLNMYILILLVFTTQFSVAMDQDSSLVLQNSLYPPLPKIITKETGIITGQELKRAFTRSAYTGVWAPSIALLEQIKIKKLEESIHSYHWNDHEQSISSEKTLLTYALELDAPYELIKLLVECQIPVFQLCFNARYTPAPLLILYKKIAEYTQNYKIFDNLYSQSAKKDAESPEATEVKESVKKALIRFQQLRALIIKAGGTPSVSFKTAPLKVVLNGIRTTAEVAQLVEMELLAQELTTELNSLELLTSNKSLL